MGRVLCVTRSRDESSLTAGRQRLPGRPGSSLVPSPVVVLRTPLLPLAPRSEGSREASGVEPIAGRVALARAHLAEILGDPAVFEALRLASPGLARAIPAWREAPWSSRGRKTERALVRYLSRMSARSTPFGLLAGISLARIADRTRLELAPRAEYRRRTRLDNESLAALIRALVRDPLEATARAVTPAATAAVTACGSFLASTMRYVVNQTLYRVGDRLRYIRMSIAGARQSFHLTSVERSEAIDRALDHVARQRDGCTRREIARAVRAGYPDIAADDAALFVSDLIDSQLVVTGIALQVTGDEPLDGLIDDLEQCVRRGRETAGDAASRREPGPTAESIVGALRGLRPALDALDRSGLAAPEASCRAIDEILAELPVPVESDRRFQVELIKPAASSLDGVDGETGGAPAAGPGESGITVHRRVIDDIARGVELLARLSDARPSPALARFREALIARHGDRRVPLGEALDEDLGVGFDTRDGPGAAVSPLLEGLPFVAGGSAGDPAAGVRFTPRHAYLLRRLQALDRDCELVLDDRDLAALTPEKPAILPDALSTLATVAARSSQAIDAGEYRVRVDHAAGPSGARLLGRFCHGSRELVAAVRDHLRAEEALRPDRVFAEVVHLPAGRVGNVLCRPALREYEIAYLGRSGLEPEKRLEIRDLEVSVVGDRVVLWSRRLGREVVPRSTTAHAYERGPAVYRFLCALAEQDGDSVAWSWGPLAASRFLPRVRHGRVVLSRARWLLDNHDLAPLAATAAVGRRGPRSDAPPDVRPIDRDAATFQRREGAVAGLRAARGLPRHVLLAEADRELWLDLDEPFGADALVQAGIDAIRSRRNIVLIEPAFGLDELCVTGPEGRFSHELHVSFIRARQPSASKSESASASGSASGQRRFAPGSEWLDARIYCGPSAIDRVLLGAIVPLMHELVGPDTGIDRWFFVRFDQPDWHLRVRVHGDPDLLHRQVLPALHRALAPLGDPGPDAGTARGVIWRIQLDTYEREVTRYGGPFAIETCERIFCADSDAVGQILALCQGHDDARWRLALAGVDGLLGDFALDIPARRAVVDRVRQSMERDLVGDLVIDTGFRRQLGVRFRAERSRLAALLAGRPADPVLTAGCSVLSARSSRIRPLCAELRAHCEAGKSTQPIVGILTSLAHMHLDRLLRSAHRAQELVIYELLSRHYRAAEHR